MKLVLSALAALALVSTDASAQPCCWLNGVNHCYYNHGWHHVGTTTGIGTTDVGIIANSVCQISARLRASRVVSNGSGIARQV
jgi:hypothetical protein